MSIELAFRRDSLALLSAVHKDQLMVQAVLCEVLIQKMFELLIDTAYITA